MSLADKAPELGQPLWCLPSPVSAVCLNFLLTAHKPASQALGPPHALPTPLISPFTSLTCAHPVYWAGRWSGHLHRWMVLLRSSWKLGYILDLWEFRGKTWPRWGILPIKRNTHRSMLLLSFQGKSGLHVGSDSEKELHLGWRWPNFVKVGAIARWVMRWLGNWGRQGSIFSQQKKKPSNGKWVWSFLAACCVLVGTCCFIIQ